MAEKYLRDTYGSLVAQTHGNWEWIVVDDCSNDNSWGELISIAKNDGRVKPFRLSANSGPSVCRNKGLELAAGEYIAFLDSDDLWLPQKLTKQLEFMLGLNIGMSCHDYTLICDDGKYLKTMKLPKVVDIDRISIHNPLGTSSVMVKKSAIGNHRFDVNLRRRQDWVFWHGLIKKLNGCHNLSMTLSYYRKGSQNSISKNKLHMACIQWKMYRTYFKLGLIESFRNFVYYAFFASRKHFCLKKPSPVWLTPLFILSLIAVAVATVD